MNNRKIDRRSATKWHSDLSWMIPDLIEGILVIGTSFGVAFALRLGLGL